MGESGNSDRFYFSWASKSLKMVTAATKLRHLLLGSKIGYEKPVQCIKKQRLTLLQRSVVSKP